MLWIADHFFPLWVLLKYDVDSTHQSMPLYTLENELKIFSFCLCFIGLWRFMSNWNVRTNLELYFPVTLGTQQNKVIETELLYRSVMNFKCTFCSWISLFLQKYFFIDWHFRNTENAEVMSSKLCFYCLTSPHFNWYYRYKLARAWFS